jgi:hypothetical protein
MAGRKSTFSSDKLLIIKKQIEESGSDKQAFEAAGVSRDTFYRWIKDKPEFARLVIDAKNEYARITRERLKCQAEKVLDDYLHGQVTVKVKITETLTSEKGSYLKETEKETTPQVPRWAIERVLGRPYDEIEALKCLIVAGWFPDWFAQCTLDEINNIKLKLRDIFAGTLPEFSSNTSTGLTAETAAAIRSHLLGIQSANAVALPTEMESGQQPDQDL